MSDFLTALHAEIADLERQLAGSPIYVKLRRAQELRDAYLITDATAPAATIVVQRDRPHTVRPAASGNSALMLDAVRAHLRGKTYATPTRELMEVLEKSGIEVGGSVPQNNVSSLLSKAPDITSLGRKGWILADSETEKAGDAGPEKAASPASVSTSTPVEPGGEVAHEDMSDNFR